MGCTLSLKPKRRRVSINFFEISQTITTYWSFGKLWTRRLTSHPALRIPISSPISGGLWRRRSASKWNYTNKTPTYQVEIPIPGLGRWQWITEHDASGSLTNCFPSAFLITSAGTPLNCRRGVIDPHLYPHILRSVHITNQNGTYIRFSTILHRSRAAFAGTAHPRFRQIS